MSRRVRPAKKKTATTRSAARTEDFQLLEAPRHGDAAFTHTDPWRVLRIMAEFTEGFGALADLGPAVTLFGSARAPEGDPTCAAA